MLEPSVAQAERPRRRAISADVVKSAGRTIQIFEIFDESRRPMRVSEVSKATSAPQSSTSALLRSLVSLGYLQYDRVKRLYFPSRRVSLLGNWVDSGVTRPGEILEMMRLLSETVNAGAVLTNINGLYAQYIYAVGPNVPKIGARGLLTRTAVGRALLSTISDHKLTALLWGGNAERVAGEAPVHIPTFMREIKDDRRKGFFIGAGSKPGLVALGVPLIRHGEVLALGIEAEEDQAENLDPAVLREYALSLSQL